MADQQELDFTAKLLGVEYRVHAIKTADGIALSLPDYDSFGDLVAKVAPSLKDQELQVILRSEYAKCMVEASKALK